MTCNSLLVAADGDRNNEPNAPMTPRTIAKLRKIFATLDSDLTHDLAFALADRIGTTYEKIVAEYEAWQIA